MGSLAAHDMALQDIDLETAITWHLRHNHYPPVPLSMVRPCLDAIDALVDDDPDHEIALPVGVEYRGKIFAPAWAIVDQHHLGPWVEQEGGW